MGNAGQQSRVDEINRLWDNGYFSIGQLDTEYLESLNAKELGELGEIVAMKYLDSHDFSIEEHHYRCDEGEADIVAQDLLHNELVFVEVKARRARRPNDEIYPEEAVDRRKIQRYRRIAGCYGMEHFPSPRMRFDVVAVLFRDCNKARIRHFRDVFQWEAAL